MCTKDPVDKHLSPIFRIQNGLKLGDALSPFLLNFALEFTIRNVKENWEGLELNGTLYRLVDDDDDLLGKNLNVIKKNRLY
jgi:hypothetical protein